MDDAVKALGDLAHEHEEACGLLEEAHDLRMGGEWFQGAWSDWDKRAEAFLRTKQEGEN